MAPNPNPQRTTAPMWEFIEQVLALEPDDFVFSGAYTLKSGYHSTVNDNLARWPGNYSVRLPADLRGPRDKGRGIDIKSRQAAAGKAPTIMAKYGSRMRAAAKARDPRVRKWREVLGQFDADRAPEAIDFQSTAERQPDDTHVWHFHWSILTEFVDDAEAYDGMYSVLIGQPLTDYQTRGRGYAVADSQLIANTERAVTALYTGMDPVPMPAPWPGVPAAGLPNPFVRLEKKVDALVARGDVAAAAVAAVLAGNQAFIGAIAHAVAEELQDPAALKQAAKDGSIAAAKMIAHAVAEIP